MIRLGQSRSQIKGGKGFTLIELLICSLLIAILSGIVLGSWTAILDWYRLKTAGQALVTHLALARAESVARNVDLCLVITADQTQYGFSEPRSVCKVKRRLPQGVRFTRVPGRALTFHSRGVAVPAGSVVLGNRLGSLKVIIPPAGRIRWEFLE